MDIVTLPPIPFSTAIVRVPTFTRLDRPTELADDAVTIVPSPIGGPSE